MSLFRKPLPVLWPKQETVDLYFHQTTENIQTFDLNLWQPKTESDLAPLRNYFHQNKITQVKLLLSDDVALTKTFIYDSAISEIDKKEVALLAQSSVSFTVDPEYIDYHLTPKEDKTLIHATIFDKAKVDILRQNLTTLAIVTTTTLSTSAAITRIIATFDPSTYFLIYPLKPAEFVLLLAKGNSLYLSSIIKNTPSDLQKLINYSNLYFGAITNKLFVPEKLNLEVNTTTKMDHTQYDPHQIALNLKLPSNLPLPVLGALLQPSIITQKPAIINQSPVNSSPTPQNTMEPKKSILPIVAVFIFTAAVASIILWFVFNRNSTSPAIESPASEQTPFPTQAPIATATPTALPTIPATSLNKNIKIQVLNATGINGQAAALKGDLVKLGFKSITTGNSTDPATSNLIKTKSKYASYAAYFASQMPDFASATTDELPDTSTSDIVFVIGTRLGGTPASTPTTTNTPSATPTL